MNSICPPAPCHCQNRKVTAGKSVVHLWFMAAAAVEPLLNLFLNISSASVFFMISSAFSAYAKRTKRAYVNETRQSHTEKI